jgi:hypothetical protein
VVSGHCTDLRRRRHDCPVQPAQRNHQKKPASTQARTRTTRLLQACSSPLQKATSHAPRRSAGRSASGSALVPGAYSASRSALVAPKPPKPNRFRRGAHERTQQRHVVGECRGGGRRHTRLHASTPTDAESDRKPEDARAVFINATRSAQHATLHSVTNGARSAAQRIRRPVCLPVGIAAGGKALRCSERLTATTGLGFSRYLGTPRGMARAAHRWARPHAPLCGAGRDGIRAQTPPPDGWYCEYFASCSRCTACVRCGTCCGLAGMLAVCIVYNCCVA